MRRTNNCRSQCLPRCTREAAPTCYLVAKHARQCALRVMACRTTVRLKQLKRREMRSATGARRPFRGFVCIFLGLFVCSFAHAQLKRAGSALFGDGVQRTPGRLEAFGSDAGAHVHSSIRPGLHRTSRAIQTIACCATATGYTAGCTKRATG